MARLPLRLAPGRLRPALAEAFPWQCTTHIAAGERQCKACCGACWFLDPGAGCQLGSMKPVRCKTYPLVPMKDKVVVHGSCPEAAHFRKALAAGDPRAKALLDVAVAMADLVDTGGDDNSEEIRWLMDYAKGAYRGPVVWRRSGPGKHRKATR